MSKAKRAYRGEILDQAFRLQDDIEQVDRVEIGEALGERYWAATLAVLGSSRWNYGKNLWIENGVVFE